MENEALVERYEQLSSDLLEWIKAKIAELNDRQFANSLKDVQQQLASFNAYRVEEKPPRFQVNLKSTLNNCFNKILGKRRTRNASIFTSFTNEG